VEIKKLSEVFKALGDPTRLKIIALLNSRDCCTCELVPLFGISQPAISRHISRLKAVGLVEENRKGQWVFFSVNRTVLEEIGYSLNHLPDCTSEFEQLEKQGLLVSCD